MALSDRFKLPGEVTPFHILSIQARAKHGKTDFAARAPGTIGFQSWDFGTDGVVQKHMDDKTILVAEYQLDLDVTADAAMQAAARSGKADELREIARQESEKQSAKIRKSAWEPFIKDYQGLLDEPSVRTIVWDTATETNEVLRLTNFGKLEKNPQIAYGPINAELKALVRKAAERRKNLILLHQMSEEYSESGDGKSMATGRYKRKGNNAIEYLVHSFVEIRKTMDKKTKEPRWEMEILEARFNPAASGKILTNPDWATLMMELMPDVSPERWLE